MFHRLNALPLAEKTTSTSEKQRSERDGFFLKIRMGTDQNLTHLCMGCKF